MRHLVADRDRYADAAVLIGARTSDDLLYPDEYRQWRDAGLDVLVTVDRAGPRWTGRVGLVTALCERLRSRPARTTAYVCGPEVMTLATARTLTGFGVPAPHIWLSLERNMQCGTGHCGHCQLGPVLICRDGPVLRDDRAAPLLSAKEL